MTKIKFVALPFAFVLLIALPTTAEADPGSGNFGQHVSTCAQSTGFDADHRPGMHRGASGWDGMH